MPSAQVESEASEEWAGSRSSGSTDRLEHVARPRSKLRLGVRVSIDLRQFFVDRRARAFMWAPYGRRVQWLSQRVARVFGLPGDVALMRRGHLLPAGEPLLLLDRDDTLEVVSMSYMNSLHGKEDGIICENSLKSTGEISGIINMVETSMHPSQSNESIKYKDISQLPISSHGDTDAAQHSISSSVCVTEHMKTLMDSPYRQNIDENDDLQRLKRRALSLLNEHCHTMHDASAPKRMRRRRRRRRPQATGCAPLDGSDDETAAAPPAVSLASHSVAAELDDSAHVMRNAAGSRPARLVPPLSPSSAAPVTTRMCDL